MGKKGSWFSALKKVFTAQSKEKLGEEPERRSAKEKKRKGFGKRRNGDNNSFLPIFREPSTIEQILGEAEREHNLVYRAPDLSEPPGTSTYRSPRPASPPRVPSQRFVSPSVPSPRPASPQIVSPRGVSPRGVSPRAAIPNAPTVIPNAPNVIPNAPTAIPKAPSPRAASPRIAQRRKEIRYRPEPTVANLRASAIKIQSAFRGYMARRSFRALKGLVRLQGVVRGQSVKRQTTNAMKYMQLLVRVQTQIQSRRIQMIENQARRGANRDESDSILGKWMASDAGNEDWDDSLLTKEEKEARTQRKINAIVKRERSMAYAYSHQLWKNSPRSGRSDIRSGGYPLWWNWQDRQLPQPSPNQNQNENRSVKDFRFTPSRPSPSPQPSSNNRNLFRFDNFDTPTPKSTKSTILTPARPLPFRTPQPHSVPKLPRGRAATPSPFKDDDSLTSCPPFSAPSYMTPTVSAKAKARANSNPRERVAAETPSGGEKRRMSFPLTQGIGSFRWNRGSLFSKQSKGSSSRGGVLEKHQTIQSIGNTSVDSTVSMPAAVGRRPFNRFV